MIKQKDDQSKTLEIDAKGSYSLKATDEIQNNQQNLLNKIIKANMTTIKILETFSNDLEKCETKQQKPEAIIKFISTYIFRLKFYNQKLNPKLNTDEQYTDEQYTDEQYTDEQQTENLISINELQLLNDKIKSYLNDYLRSNDQSTEFLCSLLDQIMNLNNQKTNQKFKYIKLTSHIIKVQKLSFSFAFNENFSLLFIGQDDGKIKVYEFNNSFKLIHVFQEHASQIGCLVWLKKSNQLASGTHYKSIIIWSKQENNSWQPYQKLEGHEGKIFSMVINKDEVLLITSSVDRTIKFWEKQENQYWICQQTIQIYNYYYSVSLNTSETMLIICGYKTIKLIEYKNDQKLWVITQTINVEEWGYRAGFLNDKQFIFQPLIKGCLEIFTYNQEMKVFVKSNQISVNTCYSCDFYFPSQFIVEKSILSVKHGTRINIFQFDLNGDLILQQSLEYSRWDGFYGKLTEDGQFLVTWDYDSKKVKIRKLSYL